ncbi:MAG: hypothetical protein ACJZ70_09935 [Limisphaerales bacterium]
MKEKQIIATKLNTVASRKKLQLSWKYMWFGLSICVGLWLLSLLSYTLFPIPLVTFLWVSILSLILPLAGLIVGFSKKFPLQDIARWIDQEKGLKERVSTAVELTEADPITPSWKELIIRDAASAIEKIETKSLLPLRLPKSCNWILLLLIACFVLGFVPERRSKFYLDQQNDLAIIDDVGANLENLTRWQVKENKPYFDPTETALDSVQDLGAEFQKRQITREDALVKISDMAEQLRSEIKKFGSKKHATLPSSEPPSKLPIEALADMQNSLSELEKNFDAAKDASSKKIDDLKSKLDAIKQTASELPDPNSTEGEQTRLDMARSLSNLSQMAQNLGLELPELAKALEDLNSSDIEQFIKNMEIASQNLSQMADLSQAIENLKMQMAESGKNLSEQLEKGQILTALGTLEDMMNQLESTGLTDQQLQNMIDELQQALSPAENYGECAQSLNAAKDSAKNGNKSGAVQELANAKEELKQMLKQMADSQNLMQALQNLERAQMAIGNAQSFCMTQRPGLSPNNKPGGGVGTWGNDSSQLTPDQMSDRWDNSQIKRPETDSRGLTNRGNKVPDNLVPSQIKGQINPNGQMPSISLRGVSITGNSRIKFQETISSAQSEALNALNQDKVPRAYRDSVRAYFDDLKK